MIQVAQYAAWISLCGAVLISLFWFKQLNKRYRLLAVYLWVTAIANLFSMYIKHTGTNLSVLPVLSLATLLLFTKLYLDDFLQQRAPVLLFLVAGAVAIICFDIYYSYDGLSVRQFYALGTVAADLCIVVFCLSYYWQSLQGAEPLDRESWILNSLFLLYFSISTLLFFSINFLVNESLQVVAPFWVINAFNASLIYAFLGYHIARYGQRRKMEYTH